MPARRPPSAQLRRLAAELRGLRGQARLSREQVEAATAISTETLYRIESAQQRPQARTLRGLLDLYGAAEAKRAELTALAKEAEKPHWLQPYQADLPGRYGAYISFEAEARSLRNYESLFIPGLLQTREYAHAVVSGGQSSATPESILQRVNARMERQKLLTAGRQPLDLWAVIDEAALRREVGGSDVMTAQVRHLIETMKLPNVTLQVIPFTAGAHPGMPGSFVHLEFRDPLDPELVYIDTMAGDLFVESADDIERYRKMFDVLRAVAVSPDETERLLVSASRKGG